MKELPAGWAIASVSDVVDEARPGFPSGRHNAAGIGVPHLRPMNVSRAGRIDLETVKYVQDVAGARLQLGDVLFNNTNSPDLVGKTAFFDRDGDWAYSNHMTRLRPSPAIDGRLLAIQLHWLWMTGFYKTILNNHVNQASVATKSLLANVRIALPPLPEQKRIVAAIEEHLSRLDAACGSLTRMQRLLERWRFAALAVLTQHLAPRRRIGDVACVGSGATPKRDRREYWTGGDVPWVTSGQLARPFVTEPAALITQKALRETSCRVWPKGTLLVALYGEGKTRGHCSELLIDAATNQACAAIQIRDPDVDPAFLKLYFNATYTANRSLSAGGVQPNLSLGLIKDMTFPCPPVAEQRAIVVRIEEELTHAANLGVAAGKAFADSAGLRRSILARAFRGELVPQDPNEEPASVLLARTTAERAAQPARGRRRAPA